MHADALNRDAVALWLRRQPPRKEIAMTAPEKNTLAYDTIKEALKVHMPTHLASTAADVVVALSKAGLLVDARPHTSVVAGEPTHVEGEVPAGVETTASEAALIEEIVATLASAPTQDIAVKVFELVREHDAKMVHATQDPKYSIRNNRLINAERNEDIP
jgi:hypothetical protein